MQGTPNPAINPTVDLQKAKDETIREFVQQQGKITLEWYVPNFCNTQVGDLIKERLPIGTMHGRIVFNCPPLREYFQTSNFELNLKMGRVYTYLDPAEDIGIPCQPEQFDLELLAEKLQSDTDTSTIHEEKLERIPMVKKIAALADIMDLEEVKHKILQYCELWKLYTEISIELKRKSKL